ncbi:TrgA family protein [uncultured Litoreibacter sp.]|uniref:TrgA family protein n=1 Tax=uncultured Litoreibacter sp. TaxID=1392394 RepID=UPI00260162BF|nr:TrgA family protein [uncultured Litoreibacter sp.]
MPTAARLIAAVLLAALAYHTSNIAKTLLPEGTKVGVFTPWAMAISVACAWRVVGRLIGRGYKDAVSTGLYAVACSMFFTCLLFAITEMIKRSTKLRYDGPMEAIVAMFGLVIEYGAMFLHPPILGALLVGGVVIGIAAEWAEKKWH